MNARCGISRFRQDSFWYQAIPSDAPSHPQSASLLREFCSQLRVGDGASINTVSYASPVYVAAEDTPTTTVQVIPSSEINASPAQYASLQDQFTDVPIPTFARPACGTDSEMTIYQPSADRLWEFWRATNNGGEWRAYWGGRMDCVSESDGIWPTPFGATATGLPFVGGQITLDELERGEINHVMGIALVETAQDTLSWPAYRGDGIGCQTGACIPEGLRFRLDPDLDVESLPIHPIARIIANAAQRFGFVVWDKAANISLRAQNPKSYPPYDANPYTQLFQPADESSVLADFPWNSLHFLPMDFGRPRSALYRHSEYARKSAQVDELVNRWISPTGPGAAVMVIQNQEILHKKGYGLARLGSAGNVPVTADTNFRLASVTKQFTAMAIAILIERGAVQLRQRLTDIFPDQTAVEVKVRHLLHHTAGLPDFQSLFGRLGMIDLLDPRSSSSPRSFFEPTNSDVVALIKGRELTHAPPGTWFEYSNTGYALLAAIIADRSGTDYATFLHDNVFAPLAMNNTIVSDGVDPAVANLAQSYGPNGTATGEDISYSPLNGVFGEDGIFSNLNDLYKWDQALYRRASPNPPPKPLVSDVMLDQIFTSGRLKSGDWIGYGFGWSLTPDGAVADHDGDWVGYKTYIRRYLKDPFTIVVLSNNQVIDPVVVGRRIDDIYYPTTSRA
jgi:CubicO group peptidase (beta-lactamase class C family)